jgi:hypothetical protein
MLRHAPKGPRAISLDACTARIFFSRRLPRTTQRVVCLLVREIISEPTAGQSIRAGQFPGAACLTQYPGLLRGGKNMRVLGHVLKRLPSSRRKRRHRRGASAASASLPQLCRNEKS